MKKHADIVVGGPDTLNFEVGYGPEGVMAVYFRLSSEPIARTIEPEDQPDMTIDLDERGKLVGIELINPIGHGSLRKVLDGVARKYKANQLHEFSKTRAEKLQELLAVD
ncbi:MAG: DUF2283 domain-containing protein [Planctomycetes bacterium]|nr:DUF2283 domain-containing protein [Planctomycetota bacterium]